MPTTNLDTIVNNLNLISARNKNLVNPVKISGMESIRSDEYEIALIDKCFDLKMPFILNKGIVDVVEGLVENKLDRRTSAKKIFNWMVSNISYGRRKLGNRGYRNSVEVFDDCEGVCGEMAMLYLVMIRTAGIRGSYAHVDVDQTGKAVNHACAMIDVEGAYGGITFVDPAYKTYDIRHKTVKPLTDFEIFKTFNQWN